MKYTTVYSLAGLHFSVTGLLIILAGIFVIKSTVSLLLGVLLQVVGLAFIGLGYGKKEGDRVTKSVNQKQNQF